MGACLLGGRAAGAVCRPSAGPSKTFSDLGTWGGGGPAAHHPVLLVDPERRDAQAPPTNVAWQVFWVEYVCRRLVLHEPMLDEVRQRCTLTSWAA